MQGHEVLELIGDLGGGKTTFVRGIAKGLGSSSHVTSPTFKITNRYEFPAGHSHTSGELAHFDLYRLNEAGVIGEEINEALHEPNVVMVLEWAHTVRDVLPQERLTIEFVATDHNIRMLKFSWPSSLDYLMRNVT